MIIDSRLRCVVCGKVRKVDFLEKIHGSWVCSIDKTSKQYRYILVDNVHASVHVCRLRFVMFKFLQLQKNVDLFNSSLGHLGFTSSSFFNQNKIVVPEPTIFLKIIKIL